MPSRREFLLAACSTALGQPAYGFPTASVTTTACDSCNADSPTQSQTVKLFVCGDVMTGRGIDQILPHPGDPTLHEPYVRSAVRYVELAEAASGAIARPVDFAYIWGDALAVLDDERPRARIVNLETAITTANDAWPRKGIHYRMHPRNVACLAAARIDCCVLGNNHVLDWGYAGLRETIEALHAASIATAGAGRDEPEAAHPAVLPSGPEGRVLVFAFGTASAGVPHAWQAGPRGGVDLLDDFSTRSVERIAQQVAAHKRQRDIVIVSLHWGSNWGYEVDPARREFARRLIDVAGVDVIHGHSSHHPVGIEIYRDRPILYGCGDFVNDYEGIGGEEAFRPELTAAYFVTLDAASGRLAELALVPLRMRRFRLGRASADEARWLAHALDRESRAFDTRIVVETTNRLVVRPK
ncbi:MAG TPA: CapA family protein [Casimicrobiaceae bacterium]|nr:CapA family protein [Casimicrobiaceae bacterium]